MLINNQMTDVIIIYFCFLTIIISVKKVLATAHLQPLTLYNHNKFQIAVILINKTNWQKSYLSYTDRHLQYRMRYYPS